MDIIGIIVNTSLNYIIIVTVESFPVKIKFNVNDKSHSFKLIKQKHCLKHTVGDYVLIKDDYKWHFYKIVDRCEDVVTDKRIIKIDL